MVETNNPPITVEASPANMESASNGVIPRMVVPDAIVTGTIRVLVASTTAVVRGNPSCCFNPISSTKNPLG